MIRSLLARLPLFFLLFGFPPSPAPGQESTTELLCEDLKDEFTLSLPAGWSAHNQMAAITGKPSPYGVVIFSPVEFKGMEIAQQIESLSGIESGRTPSFFVDRGKAGKGMSCGEMTEKARKELLKTVGNDPLFGKGRTIVEPLRADSAMIGDCQAVRIRGRSRDKAGLLSVVDVTAISDGKTLFMFSLRNDAENYEKNLPVYERAVSTVRLAGSK